MEDHIDMTFSFIPHRSHHTLTLFISRFIDSERINYSLTRRCHNSHQSGVISITVKLDLHYVEKHCSVQEEQWQAQNTSLRHP